MQPDVRERPYLSLLDYYEPMLAEHGDSHLGVGWPRADDVPTRHQVMLEAIRPDDPRPVRLLDLGCGASAFFEHIRDRGIAGV
jgi:hypothetical protein